MSDPHSPPFKTPSDAAMGDYIAVGIYGDPIRDNFEAEPPRYRYPSSSVSRRLSAKHRLFIAAWFIAIFVISAAVSPYLLN